ncbi:hypothetical protein SAMN04489712_13037 [Thermomonospora echinospora]|uniref:Uncharacterized protein n=1 Tax=Thermomonospora echinospora TaxID=1992 RepID=A0A1H6E2C5_9ACTN|nr:hypothetical protein [Thermomonospora echinospora]SEG91742.1 hypothetical protein SAMN04489712_13037 [Thermomonospora echinospora]
MIQLISVDEVPPQPEPLPSIPVPQSLHGSHEAVRALRDTPGLLHVSAKTKDRALLIAQAIADECGRRGYAFGLRHEGEPGFQITNDDICFEFTLAEELERGEVMDSEKLAAAKYDWQRVPSSLGQVFSGRLILRLEAGYGSTFWADRKRWNLDQKLPAVFKEIADRTAAQLEARDRAQAERLRRRQAWEEAIPRAKRAYLDALNRDRLHRQAARSAEAEALRSYCARLKDAIDACDDPRQAQRIMEWTQWAQSEADRIDPLHDLDSLTYVTPATIEPSDFDEFMPPGMSAYRPPD